MTEVIACTVLFFALVYFTPRVLEALARVLDERRLRLAREYTRREQERLHRLEQLRLQPCTVLCRSFLVLEQQPPYSHAIALVAWAPRNGACKSERSGSPLN